MHAFLAWYRFDRVSGAITATSGARSDYQYFRAQKHLSARFHLQLFYVRAQISAKDWIRPGRELRAEGLRPKHPVVVVPGMCLLQLQFT